jgi:hypothetical protein
MKKSDAWESGLTDSSMTPGATTLSRVGSRATRSGTDDTWQVRQSLVV